MPIVLSRKGGVAGTATGGQALSIGVSTGGNTAGDTTVNSGSRFVIVGSNGITASQGTALGATTVTLLGDGAGIPLSVGLSTGGNTAGDTTVNSGSRFVLVASGNATASQATAVGASTITLSVGTQTVQTQGVLSVGVSTGGNTSGDTTVNTGSRFVLAGGNNVTLSQATAAGATTVTISAGAAGAGFTHSIYRGLAHLERVPMVWPNGNMLFAPYQIDHNFQHNRVNVAVNYTQATDSTLTVTLSCWFGWYTRNISTLSLLSSTSGSFSINGSGTASSAQNVGQKFISFAWENTVTQNDYWLGAISSSATAGANASLSGLVASQVNTNWNGEMGVSFASSNQYMLGLGMFLSTTNAVPASVAFSGIVGQNSSQQRPWIISFISNSA